MDPRGMDRRRFLTVAGVGALAPGLLGRGPHVALPGQGATRPGSGAGRGRSWPGYDRALVVDALASPLQFNIPQEELPLSPAALADVAASGITAVNVTVGSVGAAAPDPFEASVARIAAWEREVDRHPDRLRRVRTTADLVEAKASGRLGLIYGFQDAVPFEGRLERIDLFHGLGVRIVQLTYNDRNRLGDGCLETSDGGLSRLGRAAVARMDELGILVDLSHCGPRTTLDGIEAAAGPVAITHTGCAALYPHPRNKDDETLRRLVARGGVVGIYLMPFLNLSGPPTLDHVVRHLEHALDVCGEDHVGVGSDQGIRPLDTGGDFSARFQAVSARRQALGIAAPREDTPPFVPELNHPRRMETLADALSSRGHPDRVIEKVLGTNWLRLLDEVWETR